MLTAGQCAREYFGKGRQQSPVFLFGKMLPCTDEPALVTRLSVGSCHFNLLSSTSKTVGDKKELGATYEGEVKKRW